MIQLFKVNNHKIDTSNFNNLLHDGIVERFEETIADYVGAKYACSINSATNAIFLSMFFNIVLYSGFTSDKAVCMFFITSSVFKLSTI